VQATEVGRQAMTPIYEGNTGWINQNGKYGVVRKVSSVWYEKWKKRKEQRMIGKTINNNNNNTSLIII